MKVLALDSTATTAAIALTVDGEVKADYSISFGNTHSTTLLPMIESILSVLSIKASDIDLFALSAGPGSFTGVRIGAATIKGLAFANNTPCVGVSSLEAMAWNLKDFKGYVIPSINARRNTVFCSAFLCGGESVPERLFEDTTMEVPELLEYIGTLKGEVYAVGDGAELLEKENEFSKVPCQIKLQNAVGVARLAEKIWNVATEEQRAHFTHGNLTPVYLKKPQAEREREERLNK